MEVNPLCIILVKSDSKGDRLLFRYPYIVDKHHELNIHNKRKNPYSIQIQEDILQSPPQQTSNIDQGFADEDLSTLFAVKPELCNQKFELKINDVRFVAHPTLMQQSKNIKDDFNNSNCNNNNSNNTNNNNNNNPQQQQQQQQQKSASILINIIFALHAQASYSIVKCYYELSKRLGHLLTYEEKRTSYLTDEMKLMVKTHDDLSTMTEQPQQQQLPPSQQPPTHHYYDQQQQQQQPQQQMQSQPQYHNHHHIHYMHYNHHHYYQNNIHHHHHNIQQTHLTQSASAFDIILERSTLAQCLKNIYHDLCTTGLLNTTINQWVTLSFCLPQKAHQAHKKGSTVEPETIDRCLQSLKPYHGMLLLVDYTELLDCVPPSGARMLLQLINAYNPLKTLQNMSSDAELLIEHVYQLVGHLVYWAKATIIYPLCETNVYVIAPDAPLHINSPLVDKFAGKFPGMSLFEVISDFSLPTSIGHLTTPLQHPTRQGTLAQMVLWMLQHHLLMQLHTYVQFMPTDHGVYTNYNHSSRQQFNDLNGGGGDGDGEFMNIKKMKINEDDDDDEDEDDEDESILSVDDIHGGSLFSTSSQPMPVPNTSRRSITDEHFSETLDGTISELIAVQTMTTTTTGNSSQKSNYSLTTHSTSTSLSTEAENCESLTTSIEDEDKIKELLMVFHEPERTAIGNLPATSNAEDLALMVKLWQAGYFKGEHHLEEIMYFENLRRSQLLQLLDKFRDVLIIYETEDPAIATLYTQHSQ